MRDSYRARVGRVIETDRIVISITDLRMVDRYIFPSRGHVPSAAAEKEKAHEAHHAKRTRLAGLCNSRRVSVSAKTVGARRPAGIAVLDVGRRAFGARVSNRFPARLAPLAAILDSRMDRKNRWSRIGPRRLPAEIFRWRFGIRFLPAHGAGDYSRGLVDRLFRRDKTSA